MMFFHLVCEFISFNLLLAMLIILNSHPHEIASRYRDPQLQMGENYS